MVLSETDEVTDRLMTYQETLDYMFSQLPMYQRQGAVAFKKDLGNILTLSAEMGDPHKSFLSIHIAGTNGKGTVAHMMAASLQAHGLKVGVYTSPHYMDFRERFKINGQFISEAEVISFVEEYKVLFAKVKPSFFEMTVAMAFDFFANRAVDVAIIETGLGGRLDSTNIITPELSVITNISHDHQAMLGNTLPLIAAEKAGIIKAHVPVVIGEFGLEVNSTFVEVSAAMTAPMEYADRHVQIEQLQDGLRISVDGAVWIPLLKHLFPTSFYIKNLRTALYSLYVLQERFSLIPQLIAEGIQHMNTSTYYIGRFQQLLTSPQVIADSAHNIAGVQELLINIRRLNYRKLHVLLGMVNDKDITDVLRLLPTDADYYFTKAKIPRALAAEELQIIASSFKLEGNVHSSVKDAYEATLANADEADLILIMGSVFVVAEVLALAPI